MDLRHPLLAAAGPTPTVGFPGSHLQDSSSSPRMLKVQELVLPCRYVVVRTWNSRSRRRARLGPTLEGRLKPQAIERAPPGRGAVGSSVTVARTNVVKAGNGCEPGTAERRDAPLPTPAPSPLKSIDSTADDVSGLSKNTCLPASRAALLST